MPNQFRKLDGTLLSTSEVNTVWETAEFHGISADDSTLTYVCLECGTIGVSENAEARAINQKHINLNCCGEMVTVLCSDAPETL